MKAAATYPKDPELASVFSGDRRAQRHWPDLAVDYAWLPPFDGCAPTRPNRLEVVFSEHHEVAVEFSGRTYEIDVQPGAMYVVGAEATTLLRVGRYSDTLEMFPSQDVLDSAAAHRGIAGFEFQPTLGARRRADFVRDATVLGIGHVLRRACLGMIALADIEASCLAHALADRILTLQNGEAAHGNAGKLEHHKLALVCEFIESNLEGQIVLAQLARLVGLSPFHLSRAFKASSGLAPHQYVLARRIERAKHLLMTTGLPTREVAWAVGYENISHFRRLFIAHLGVTPGGLRHQTATVCRGRLASSRHSRATSCGS